MPSEEDVAYDENLLLIVATKAKIADSSIPARRVQLFLVKITDGKMKALM
ncbi:hypothetical protein F441_11736 [Phytophthora nicotianae CJ01A1]|uniref:Uncharacterized protein n=4 Tax=Phytophthora nicotianae TaxID=4792 RepID=W2PP78_PHYN3|nr:hypothetical protein PPTG_23916 [Phytophthora nicotianae INRA-310]ETI43229.1 hypothetical protein F443_11783 [Phytophthora nicotianae P1569]ETN02431.1 hypothetical protein PPTG_23916 [Phytophthora nicotianae INRA-310]ETP12996.1 hypothetical protein F441_11736 [Phytophthora nicotianae CJ01A1]ETP41101.1 hypothetical protein F442_11691 [Phytophthora nicotianae P10297]